MSNLPSINDTNFQEILNAQSAVVVDFSATWCGPCKKLAPLFEEIATTYQSNARFMTCDVGESPDFARQYGIMSVPTIMIFKNGSPVETIVGLQSKERLTDSIKKHM
ncbi:MAG: thioredoxin [Candidatus Delongbacteria bacterium]|nr:thioredoxin [Candidatus Delongbacteria bacterium]